MRDSPYSLHTPARAYGFAGFKIPFLKALIARLKQSSAGYPPVVPAVWPGRQYTKQFRILASRRR